MCTFVLRKINEKCCHQSGTFLTPVCTKSFAGWCFIPDPTGEAYSAHPDPLAGFKGPYFYVCGRLKTETFLSVTIGLRS